MMETTASEERARTTVLVRLLALCWADRRRCLIVLLTQVGLLTIGLVGLSSAGLGLDYLASHLHPDAPPVRWPLGLAPPDHWPPMVGVTVIAAIVVLAAILRSALNWASGTVLARLVHTQVIGRLQTAVFTRLQQLPFQFYATHSRGEIINRATGDIASIRAFVDTILVQAIVTTLSAGVFVAYMVNLHASLAVACLVPVPFALVICLRYSRIVHPLYLQNRSLFDRLILTLAESIEGAGIIRGFGREPEVLARFRAENDAVQAQQGRIFRRMSVFTPTIDMLTQASLVILLIYGGWLVIHGKLPLGTGLIVFAGLLQQFANQVTTIAQIANGIQESLTGAQRVFALLDTPPGPPEVAQPRKPPSQGTIEFREVCFSYCPDTPDVLHQVSFEVKPGECVAIVGETGSGKSALLDLIPRFYDATSGSVVIDGVNVREWDLQALRRRIGVVFQENLLFSETVAANIAFGAPAATREQIETAARAACAHEFIVALPHGYDTVLGESGVNLSGGQRQRLTIARALLMNPAILLLDDPTAAIDPETGHEILAAVEQAVEGRTTIVVAHQLSTLRRADRIVVLERGRVVQTGTHEALLREAGPYREAARHQMIDAESRRLLAPDSDLTLSTT